jgi:hypothetical protein
MIVNDNECALGMNPMVSSPLGEATGRILERLSIQRKRRIGEQI